MITPHLVTDIPSSKEVLLRTFGFSSSLHFGANFPFSGWYYLSEVFPLGFGWLPLGLSALGLIHIISSRKIGKIEKFNLLAFSSIFLAIMGKSHIGVAYYMLPLFPFLAIYAALGVKFVANISWLQNTQRQPIRSLVIFAAISTLILQNLYSTGLYIRLIIKGDTRENFRSVAKEWSQSLPDGKLKLLTSGSDPYTGFLSPKLYNGQLMYDFKTASSVETQLPDLVIFDSYENDRAFFDRTPGRSQSASWLRSYPEAKMYHVIQISPFRVDKQKVPLSRAPALIDRRDLVLRRTSGPFIEMYFKDKTLHSLFMETCIKVNVKCDEVKSENSYYMSGINREIEKNFL